MFVELVCALGLLHTGANPYETNLRGFGNSFVQTRPATAIAAGEAYIYALQDDGVVVRHGYTPYSGFNERGALSGVKALHAQRASAAFLLKDDSLVARMDYGVAARNIPRIGPIRDFKVSDYALLVLPDTGNPRCWILDPSDTGTCRLPRFQKRVRSIGVAYDRFFAIFDDSTLIEWYGGIPADTLIAPVPLPRGVISAAGDNKKSYALLSDGTVRSWSFQRRGVRGQIDSVEVRDVQRIAGDYDVVAFQKKDGTVYARDPYSFSMVRAPELDGSLRLEAGWYEVAGLKSDGTIATYRVGRSATNIPRLGRVVEVFGTEETTVAIREDGSAEAWGYDNWSLAGPFRTGRAYQNRFLLVGRDGTLKIVGNNVPWWHGDTIPLVTTVPAGLTGIAHIEALPRCNVVVRDDASTLVWGDTSDSSGCNIHLPASLPGIRKLQAFGGALLAWFVDGSIRLWGAQPPRAPDHLAGWATLPQNASYDGLALDSAGRIVFWGRDTTALDPALDRNLAWKAVAQAKQYVFALGRDGILRSVGGKKSAPWIGDYFPRLDSIRSIDGETLFGFVAQGTCTGVGVPESPNRNGLQLGVHAVAVQDVRGRTIWTGSARWDGRAWNIPLAEKGIFFVRAVDASAKPMRLVHLER